MENWGLRVTRKRGPMPKLTRGLLLELEAFTSGCYLQVWVSSWEMSAFRWNWEGGHHLGLFWSFLPGFPGVGTN